MFGLTGPLASTEQAPDSIADDVRDAFEQGVLAGANQCGSMTLIDGVTEKLQKDIHPSRAVTALSSDREMHLGVVRLVVDEVVAGTSGPRWGCRTRGAGVLARGRHARIPSKPAG